MLTSSKGIQPSNSTDAQFRAWSKFIFDGMVAGGWVQTADTGQIDFATVTRPTIANSARGYAVLRMDDSLQASVPVFARLDFGSGGAATVMAVWMTLGPSSDGAGAIGTPWLSNPTTAVALIQAGSSSTSLIQPFSWVSADTARAQVAVAFNAAASTTGLVFSLERTKTASGGDDGTGLLFLYGFGSASFNRNQYLFAADVTQPPVELGSAAVLTLRAPGVTSHNWGIGVPIPFAGLAQQPGSGVLVTQLNDASVIGRFVIYVYGERIIYQNVFSARLTGFGHDGTSQVLLRAD